jgi:hypothetical protein
MVRAQMVHVDSFFSSVDSHLDLCVHFHLFSSAASLQLYLFILRVSILINKELW